MTSRDLAAEVTLTPQYVRLIECGNAIPAMPTVLRIANVFPGVESAEWLWVLLTDLWGAEIVDVMMVAAQSREQGGGEG